MFEQGDSVYERVTSDGVVVSRPVYLDALITMNRHAIITLLTALNDGFSTPDKWKFTIRSPAGGSTVLIFEHPITINKGVYTTFGSAASQEAIIGYRTR